MFFVNSPLQRKSKLKDNIDLALSDWFSAAEFSKHDIYPKLWAEQYIHLCTGQVYHWLRSRNIEFLPAVNWTERGYSRRGNTVPRFHMPWGCGEGIVNNLKAHLEGLSAYKKLKILHFHKGENLIVENGQAKGIEGIDESKNESFTVKAENTIIAAGGILGSKEKVKKYWPSYISSEAPKNILNGSHPFALGDMHDAVERINGKITHLDKQWNYAAGIKHPKPLWKDHGLSLVPIKSGIWLNSRGERLGSSEPIVPNLDTLWLVQEVCKQEKKFSWQILNKKIAYKEFAISGSEHNNSIREKKKFQFLKTLLLGNKKLVKQMIDDSSEIIVADNLESLVSKMNELEGNRDLSLEKVRETIEDFDIEIEKGPKLTKDFQLQTISLLRKNLGDKLRTCNFQKILDPSARPLIAIRNSIITRKSLGGIQTDLSSRVLSESEEVIPNLYAVGEAAGFGGGGIHGKRSLEGTFLGSCVLTARIAGKHILGKSV